MKELFALGFVQVRTVIGSRIRIESGQGTESKTGAESQLKAGVKLRKGLGLKTSVGSESKTRRGLRMTSIDTKDEKNHSMSMLTELWTLIIGKSHLQERAKKRLPGQLVYW
ncbi:hypothetical protein EVAR_46944_1 [Eumeta japonica]|uniref:Uncharacterized protein n=1 Tax=Eumeta variegata TaxID=151549 RepID=A0A4C1YIR8_EUMVA|nr:hypothetical protein EVAR_46944_1 [Eumeta japonica]